MQKLFNNVKIDARLFVVEEGKKMIYTVTFNPSIDYMVSVSDLQLGRTNRSDAEYILPGGKGINVSTVLNHLGMKSVALGFVAGFTGEQIGRMVADRGINSQFICLEEGMSRINIKLHTIDGTEINGSGPLIPANKLEELLTQLDSLQAGDVLFLSGSVPVSVPYDIYAQIAERVSDKCVNIVVDAAGKLLMQTLEHKPFLIKPNLQELQDLFGAEIFAEGVESADDLRKAVVPYGEKIQKMGARNVLISLGGEGAVLLAEDGRVYSAPAPVGEVVNTVGAGDSMVAGFMAGWLDRADYKHAFYMGLAAGSASAFSVDLATKEEIEKVYKQIVGCLQ